jgi:glutathione synthase/RimK-type ligase-like ATP-grasp enzyme/ribosomal protein S18 acetylase RimI-like enzyme
MTYQYETKEAQHVDIQIRPATPEDLPFLERLERESFPAHRCSSRRSLRQSLVSPIQTVLIATTADSGPLESAGAVIFFTFRRSVRIYSLAVLPAFRGAGVGEQLLKAVFDDARLAGISAVTLEADAANPRLLEWYRSFGFTPRTVIADYYADGEDALRMGLSLADLDGGTDPVDSAVPGSDSAPDSAFIPGSDSASAAGSLPVPVNIVVLDKPSQWPLTIPNVEVVSARSYLEEQRFQISEAFRVFNLCGSYRKQKMGYYVSLLASARNHKIVPSVIGINDFSNVSLAKSVVEEIDPLVQKRLEKVKESEVELDVYFGDTPRRGYSELAAKLQALLELPLFRIVFARTSGSWHVKRVQVLSFTAIPAEQIDLVGRFAARFFQRKRFNRPRIRHYRYDLAILVNPNEKTPPSSDAALVKFREAGERIGLFVERISKQDYNRINEYDALFIRETTAVENHTYTFARRAYTEGLVVIDDPWSILRCSNKMFLYERLARNRVAQPRSWILVKGKIPESRLRKLSFPLVLKLPESSFSQGVYRVDSPEELHMQLKGMFRTVEVVIAQEFVQTAYDWRIGVLDNAPLYACKYHMATGHWQIYNWKTDESDDAFAGEAETFPISQVPGHIVQTALRAASCVGDGLYGVDLKDIRGRAHVIEVNDNPNIDAGIEDAVLQDELYDRVMMSFLNRIERERLVPRFVN